MGANYLLGGEEQEGWMLLLFNKKKNNKNEQTTHLPVSASGRNSKQGKTANTLTFYVKFYRLIWKMQDRGWIWTETPAPAAHDAAQFCRHWRKTTQPLAPSSVYVYVCVCVCVCVCVVLKQGLRYKLLQFAASLCFLSLLHPDCYRGPTIHIYPFLPTQITPSKKKKKIEKKRSICSSLNLKYTSKNGGNL